MTLKKQFNLFSWILFSVYGFSQTNFVKGYFITNENDRVECLINDISWKENPTIFEFKLNEGTEIQKKGISEVKEFGIGELIRYIRTDINIDRSFRDGESEISDRKPNYVKQTVFIEVLIDGLASLYVYKEDKDKWFFFKSGIDSEIQQLIYRKYFPKKGSIEEYSPFRQQLKFAGNCSNISSDRLKKVEYTQNDLGSIFLKYNSCRSSKQTSFVGNRDRGLFTFTLRPGLEFNDISLSTSFPRLNYEAKLGYRLGFEMEKLFLMQDRRWALIIEPTFKYLALDRDGENDGLETMELPIGVRHYFTPNLGNGFFLDASYVLDLSVLNNSFTGGIGYKHKSNLSIQGKISQRKNLEKAFVDIEGNLNTYTIILGYSF